MTTRGYILLTMSNKSKRKTESCDDTEPLLSLSRLASMIPAINGKRTTESTLRTWIKRGVNSVFLRTKRVGNRIVTTWKEYERFDAEINAKIEKLILGSNGGGK